MNVLQHTRDELNLWLKQNRPDRSYRDRLLMVISQITNKISNQYTHFVFVANTINTNFHGEVHRLLSNYNKECLLKNFLACLEYGLLAKQGFKMIR